MSYQLKYVYNGELDKNVLHLPLFSIHTRKRSSDILSICVDNVQGVYRGGDVGGRSGRS